MKLKELLHTWLNKYAKHTLKTRSYNGYFDVIKLYINPILENYEIQDITLIILQDYVIEKLKSYYPQTISV